MRELKFRAWDKRTRKMVETGFHILGEVSAFDLLYQYGIEHGKRKNEPGLMRMNSFEFMQFTGLKDKNGKEIYEGDILSYGMWSDGKGQALYKVLWDECGFITFDLRHNQNMGGIDLFDAEIIGNIYESPELLK